MREQELAEQREDADRRDGGAEVRAEPELLEAREVHHAAQRQHEARDVERDDGRVPARRRHARRRGRVHQARPVPTD